MQQTPIHPLTQRTQRSFVLLSAICCFVSKQTQNARVSLACVELQYLSRSLTKPDLAKSNLRMYPYRAESNPYIPHIPTHRNSQKQESRSLSVCTNE